MYTPEEYKKILQMSPKKRVLVEGRDDLNSLSILFEEFLGDNWRDVYNIELERADTFLIGVPEVRKRIETVVALISETELRNQLVGFVDREFRKFSWENGELIDQISRHFIDDRILWTRGHSIENYFLDEKILKTPFQIISGEVFQKSYNLFKKNLNSYLRVACKLSLVALKLDCLKKIRTSLGWDIIEENASLNIKQWKIQLNKIGFDSPSIEKITTAYEEFSYIIDSADTETVRWFCDGHLSFYFLWCAFARCVYAITEQINDKATMAQRILKYGDEHRFNSCASAWAKSSQANLCEYPKDIFAMLNLSEENESIL